MATVVLFDIDGTLVSTGGAGQRALERALEESLALQAVRSGFSFAGMTDRMIVRRLLEELAQEASEAAIDAVLEVYLRVLQEEVAAAERYRIHAGMEACLDALAGREQVAVGLGTGNVEAGARIKLERVALNGHFAFGGFGCDAEDRAELIRMGAQRGARRLGRSLGECRVVIVGDTPRDVAAAHAIGAECLAVATGGASRDQLRAAGADHLFDTIAERGALEVLVG